MEEKKTKYLLLVAPRPPAQPAQPRSRRREDEEEDGFKLPLKTGPEELIPGSLGTSRAN